MTVVWVASGFYTYIFIDAYNPWPLSVYQHYAVKQHLLKTGVIPENAKNIYVRDSHAGFHGDGNRFITFVYEGDVNNVPNVKAINSNIDYFGRNPDPNLPRQTVWGKSPLGKPETQ